MYPWVSRVMCAVLSFTLLFFVFIVIGFMWKSFSAPILSPFVLLFCCVSVHSVCLIYRYVISTGLLLSKPFLCCLSRVHRYHVYNPAWISRGPLECVAINQPINPSRQCVLRDDLSINWPTSLYVVACSHFSNMFCSASNGLQFSIRAGVLLGGQ